jgi:hypothetical protein
MKATPRKAICIQKAYEEELLAARASKEIKPKAGEQKSESPGDTQA